MSFVAPPISAEFYRGQFGFATPLDTDRHGLPPLEERSLLPDMMSRAAFSA